MFSFPYFLFIIIKTLIEQFLFKSKAETVWTVPAFHIVGLMTIISLQKREYNGHSNHQ